MLKCVIPKNQNIFLDNHTRVIDIRKFNIDVILLSILHIQELSIGPLIFFIAFFFFPGSGSSPASWFASSSHVSLVSFYLKQLTLGNCLLTIDLGNAF